MSNIVTSVLVLSLVFSIGETCEEVAVEGQPEVVDVTCVCLNKLSTTARTINKLTLDGYDCDFVPELNVSLHRLDMDFHPKSITIIGYLVTLLESDTNSLNSTITKLEFKDCNFESIAKNAFSGLTKLTELLFENDYIKKLEEDAISNLPNLKNLTISESDIDMIENNAVNTLPVVNNFQIVSSTLSIIKNKAINIKKNTEETLDCSRQGSTREKVGQDDQTLSNIEANVEAVSNIGPSLFIENCNIARMENGAIESDIFSFIIFTGNKVDYLGLEALKLETVECHISAAIIRENVFARVETEAFAGLKTKNDAPYQAYLVLNGNLFGNVSRNGFLVSSLVQTFPSRNNKFICICDNFQWFVGEDQVEDRSLLGIMKFTSSCEESSAALEVFQESCPDLPYFDEVKVNGGCRNWPVLRMIHVLLILSVSMLL